MYIRIYIEENGWMDGMDALSAKPLLKYLSPISP